MIHRTASHVVQSFDIFKKLFFDDFLIFSWQSSTDIYLHHLLCMILSFFETYAF